MYKPPKTPHLRRLVEIILRDRDANAKTNEQIMINKASMRRYSLPRPRLTGLPSQVRRSHDRKGLYCVGRSRKRGDDGPLVGGDR